MVPQINIPTNGLPKISFAPQFNLLTASSKITVVTYPHNPNTTPNKINENNPAATTMIRPSFVTGAWLREDFFFSKPKPRKKKKNERKRGS
jgi:hypothetical protein